MSKRRFLFLVAFGFATLLVLVRVTQPTPKPATPPFVLPQTWHLTGWRTVAGKKLPWELWGQANPPLSDERLGDGVQWTLRGKAVVQTPALPGYPPFLIQNLVVGQHNWLQILQTSGDASRDPATQLPRHYTLRTGTGQVEGELTAQYNLPLPADRKEPPRFSSPTIDLETPLEPLPSDPKTFAGKGVTFWGQAVAQDIEGNLYLQAKITEGLPSSPQKLPYVLTTITLATQQSTQANPRNTVINYRTEFSDYTAQDEQGKNFLVVYKNHPTALNLWEVTLIRLTPLAAGLPYPKTVHLTTEATLKWDAPLLLYFHPYILQNIRERVTITLPPGLPSRALSSKERLYNAKVRSAFYRSLLYRDFPRTEKLKIQEKARDWMKRAGEPLTEQALSIPNESQSLGGSTGGGGMPARIQ